MLKERYKYKLRQLDVQLLSGAMDALFSNYGNTKDVELMLPIVVLKDFKMRLAGQMVFEKESTPLFLKSTEALAFLSLYKCKIIESNLATTDMAHQIDRTL